jgi:hypothetical protein
MRARTNLANGIFLIRRSVERWYLRISRSATVPGRNLCFFCAGAALAAARSRGVQESRYTRREGSSAPARCDPRAARESRSGDAHLRHPQPASSAACSATCAALRAELTPSAAAVDKLFHFWFTRKTVSLFLVNPNDPGLLPRCSSRPIPRPRRDHSTSSQRAVGWMVGMTPLALTRMAPGLGLGVAKAPVTQGRRISIQTRRQTRDKGGTQEREDANDACRGSRAIRRANFGLRIIFLANYIQTMVKFCLNYY